MNNNVWVTADLHLGHGNIIKYCNRPFSNIKDMDDAILDNLNRKVKPNDTLYYLGDFCAWYGNDLDYYNRFMSYRLDIKCKNIIYIYGNHDKKMRKNHRLREEFVSCQDYLETNINGQDITMTHYLMLTWNKMHYGAWNLGGHSHGSVPDDPSVCRLDVCLETHNYCPWHFDEIKEFMSKKTFKAIDHHGAGV